MRAPVLVALLSFSLILNAATRISPEQPVAEPRPGAPRTLSDAAVASDGSHAMVVWVGDGGLTGTVVDSDGNVPVSPRPPQIPIDPQSRFKDVCVVWTGGVYLVVWTDESSGVSSVRTATLSADGTLLTPATLVASNAVTRRGALAAGNQGAYGVYFLADTHQFRGMLFDRNGAIVATDLPLPAVKDTDPTDIVRVASDGNEYAYVWRIADDSVISAASNRRFDTFRLQRLSSAGAAIGSSIKIARLESTASYDLAYGGGKYALVAIEQQFISLGDSWRSLARYIVDASARTVLPLARMDASGFASVIWNGRTFIAYGAAADDSGLQTIAFNESETGAPQPVTIPSLSPLATPSMKIVDGRLLAIWTVNRAVGAILDGDGAAALRGPFLVSVSWSSQMMPAVAASSTDCLVIWVEDGGILGSGLLGRRFTRTGQPLGSPFLIADATIDETPALTFTGIAYQAVWRERSRSGAGHIVARSIALDGSLGPRIELGPGSGVSAASNDKVTLVAFASSKLVAYRLAPDGSLLSPLPIEIASSDFPRTATNGSDFFIAWEPGGRDVVGIRVFANGAVDATPLPIASGGSRNLAALASDGRDYTVFQWSLSPAGQLLTAKRVLREGQLDGTTADDSGNVVATLPSGGSLSPTAVNAARDQYGFFVSWFDNVRNDAKLRLIHTDRDATPLEMLPVFSYVSDPLAIAGLSDSVDGPSLLVYGRTLASGKMQVFVRSVETVITRRRATHH